MKYIYLDLTDEGIIESFIEIDNGNTAQSNFINTAKLKLFSYDESDFKKPLRKVIKFGEDNISLYPELNAEV
jgi:hypothetical protein